MSTGVLASFFDSLASKLSSPEALESVTQNKGVAYYQPLEKLRMSLWVFLPLLHHVEETQSTHEMLKVWLTEVQYLAYDLDDILDMLAIESLKCKVMKSKVGRVSPFFIFHNRTLAAFKILREVENIVQRMDNLVSLGKNFHPHPRERLRPTPLVYDVLPSTYDVASSYVEVVPTNEIAQSLLNYHDDGVAVVSIVGMGGIGKTTAAKLAYNDPRVRKCFQCAAWVTVSLDFDVTRITKNILQQIRSDEAYGATDLRMLQIKLKDRLDGKRFLLVLDDVWIKNYAEWKLLASPLQGGASGSKILVTTRSDEVSQFIGTTKAHHLPHQQAEEACFSIFTSALGKRDFSEYPHLEEIGKKIVRRCNGVPLLAKVIGGFLRNHLELDVWTGVLEGDLWNLSDEIGGILPALKFSYDSLSASLKQCFAYCSIFPKEFDFKEEEIVLLWMAEGFLSRGTNIMEMEELGRRYHEALVARSLFQRSSMDESQFQMHDLIHSLAQSVAGPICFRMEHSTQMEIPESVRYLSYNSSLTDEFKNFKPPRRLRTFIPFVLPNHTYRCIPYNILLDLLPRLKFLRALSLREFSESKVPDIIGRLRHLRYLDLSNAALIKSLPVSICTLYNLQTLLLRQCLKLKKLPSNIGNLVKLRHLDVTGTLLTEIPTQIGELSNLQALFTADGRHIRGRENIRNLLRGPSISSLENIAIIEGAPRTTATIVDVPGTTENVPGSISSLENIATIEVAPGTTATIVDAPGITETISGLENTATTEGALETIATIVDASGTTENGSGSISGLENSATIEDATEKTATIVDAPGTTENRPGSISSLENSVTIENASGTTVTIVDAQGTTENRPGSISGLENTATIEDAPNTIATIVDAPETIENGPGSISGLENTATIEDAPTTTAIIVDALGTPENESGSILGLENTATIEDAQATTGDGPGPISRLENIATTEDGKAAILGRKQGWLKWSESTDGKKIEKLIIKGYHDDTKLPTWLVGSLFSSLRSLEVNNCKICKSMLSIGNLRELRNLCIKEMSSLRSMDVECFAGNLSLETLSFEDIPQWEGWNFDERAENFGCLRELSLIRCPKLSGRLPSQLPSLKKLVIRRCNRLVVSISRLPVLHQLEIDGCKNLVQESSVEISSLKKVSLSNISELTCLPKGLLFGLAKLDSLQIDGCQKLTSLWENKWKAFVHMRTLKKLMISNCPKLVPLGGNEDEEEQQQNISYVDLPCWKKIQVSGIFILLHELKIENCPMLVSFSEESFPTALKILVIRNCKNLEYFLEKGKPTNFRNSSHLENSFAKKNLEDLKIEKCPSLIALSTSSELPIGLQKLHIEDCPKLASLSSNAKLPEELKLLHISHCPELKSIGDELPVKLQNLQIWYCKNLTALSPTGMLPEELKSLQISNCPRLESIAQEIHDNRSLEYIGVIGCVNIHSLPQGLDKLSLLKEIVFVYCPSLSFRDSWLPRTNLKVLHLDKCEKFKAFPNNFHELTTLQELEMSCCPIPNNGFPAKLESLSISLPKPYKPLEKWGLGDLACLSRLNIEGGCPELVSFPLKESLMMLPDTLVDLTIKDFPDLKSLSSSGFEKLTSLKYLSIMDCPKVRSLPSKNALPELSRLHIDNCPLLRPKCIIKGKEWSKIAHIDYVRVDDRLISAPID